MKLGLLLILLLSFPLLFAKDVEVKYRDSPVNVDSFKKYTLKPSSLVKKMFYNEKNKYLIVKINRYFYQYCKINKTIIEKWIESKSLGAFYLSEIKGKYICDNNKYLKSTDRKPLEFYLRSWLAENIFLIDKKKSITSFEKYLINNNVSATYINSLNLNKYLSIENFISKNRIIKTPAERMLYKFFEMNQNSTFGSKTDSINLMDAVNKLSKKDQKYMCNILASRDLNNFLEIEWYNEQESVKFIRKMFKLNATEKQKLRKNSNKKSIFDFFFKDEYSIGEDFVINNDITSYSVCELVLTSEKEIRGCFSAITKKKYKMLLGSISGYKYTKDCTNYDTGYEWAENNDIDNTEDCIGSENSYFFEGCADYVRNP